MSRAFVLGNGTVLVGIDEQGRVRDFYYPYVGQENHIGGKIHKIGIWVDGQFSWFDDSSWHKTLSYEKETLVSNILFKNKRLKLEVQFNDIVHHKDNIFLRKATVFNKGNKKREIRLFFHQIFNIYEANIGNTAYYNPFLKSIIHYRGKRYFLVNGSFLDVQESGISSFATGLTGELGKEGTHVDAQDGQLSGNLIEHGSVDSTVSFNFFLPEHEKKDVYYWICVGKDFVDVRDLNDKVVKKTPQALIDETADYWHTWVNKTEFEFMGLPDNVVDLFKRSLLIIKTHVDKNGAIIASSDSDALFLRRDTYNYMWPRDGALIARSLDRAGYSDITENFFKFCIRVITDEGYLLHKYRPDSSLGSSWHPWMHEGHIQLPIQEDQIALVIDAMWKHYVQHQDEEMAINVFYPFVRKAADFIIGYIDQETGLPQESYDLWEEKLGIHTWTCATIFAALRAAGHFEQLCGTKEKMHEYMIAANGIKEVVLNYFYNTEHGYFIKGCYYDGGQLKQDPTNDASSVYGVLQFGLLPATDERIQKSFQYYKKRLICKTKVGGYARYEGDDYFKVTDKVPGNPWFITTLWLAEYYISVAKTIEDLEPAKEIFKWVVDHALSTGVLAEQLNPLNGQPLSVAPLTWSHAGFVIAINKYLEKLDTLGICQMCNPPKYTQKEQCEVCTICGVDGYGPHCI